MRRFNEYPQSMFWRKNKKKVYENRGRSPRRYANTPMYYEEISKVVKNDIFLDEKKTDIFLIFAQNIDCGYTLEPPQ